VSYDPDGEELAIDDDIAIEALGPFHDARPSGSAWRTDLERAPFNKTGLRAWLSSVITPPESD